MLEKESCYKNNTHTSPPPPQKKKKKTSKKKNPPPPPPPPKQNKKEQPVQAFVLTQPEDRVKCRTLETQQCIVVLAFKVLGWFFITAQRTHIYRRARTY